MSNKDKMPHQIIDDEIARFNKMNKESNISDWPALQAWLDKHNARFCYSLLPRTAKEITPSIEAWKVNGAIVLVVLYPGSKGWDVFTSLDDNSTERTLADVERRITPLSITITEGERKLCDQGLGAWRSDYNDAPIDEIETLRGRLKVFEPAPAPGDPLMAFVKRGVAAQAAVDEIAETERQRILKATDLQDLIRNYLDQVDANRAEEIDLDDRVKAREAMTRIEEEMKQLIEWKSSRPEPAAKASAFRGKLTDTEKKIMRAGKPKRKAKR